MKLRPSSRLLLLSAAALTLGGAALPVSAQDQGVAPPPFGGPQGGPPGMGGGRMGGGPGGGQQERKLVAQFDKNGDKRLDTAERAEARAWLATQPQQGGPGGGGRGGPGGPGGGRGPGGQGGPGGQFAPPGGGQFGGPGGGGGGRGGPGGGPGGGEGPRVAMVPGTKGGVVTQKDVKTYPAATSLYERNALRTLFLQFENADWEAELAAFNNTDVEVPATVAADGKTYKNVGVHFRGNSSYSMVPAGNKRSLNLSFDFVEEDQKLLGYKSLNLLNSMGDPTFLKTVIYSKIAREMTAAPKVNLVHVVINGENWGLYLNAQQFNKDMMVEAFGDGSGARWSVPGSPGARGGLEYLGADATAYKSIYEIKTKDDAADWAKFIELTRVLNETPADKLEAALKPILDVDGALKFLALDVALGNSDGYWTRASDYNIYLDKDGRFHVLPHDINEAMSGNTSLDPLVGLDDATKPLRSKLLAVPALRARYLGYVRQIATTGLDWKTLGPLAEQHRALVAGEVAADTRKLYSTEAFDTGLASLKTWTEARRAYLLGAS